MNVINVIAFLIIYLEMIFKFTVLKSVKIIDIATTLLFTAQIIMTLNLLCNIFKEKVSKAIFYISTVILTIYFIIQTIFYNLFSVPFSFMTLGLASNALDFTNIIKDAIIQKIGKIILLIIPLILIICIHKKIKFKRFNIKQIGIRIVSIIIILLALTGVIFLDRNGVYSSYNLFFNINAQEKNIAKFGLINSTVIDIYRTIFGFEEKAVIEDNNDDNTEENPETDACLYKRVTSL